MLAGASVVTHHVALVYPNCDWSDVVIALVLALVAGWFFAALFLRLFGQAATAVFVACTAILLLAHCSAILPGAARTVAGTPFALLGRRRILMPLIVVAYLAAVCLFARFAGKSPQAVPALTFAAIAMFVFPVVDVLKNEIGHLNPAPAFAPGSRTFEPSTASRPDIYYIVLDSYTSNESLEKYWHYDNGPFVDGLRGMGFHVIRNAQSCSTWSLRSVASVFDMQYDFASSGSDTLFYHNEGLYRLRKSWVPQTLQKMGYQIVNISPFYLQKVRPFSFCSFGNYSMSLKDIFYDHGLPGLVWRALRIDRRPTFLGFDAVASLQELERVPLSHTDKPRFVYCHVGLPHSPFVLSKRRNEPSGNSVDSSEEMAMYAEQVNRLNKLVLNSLKRVLQRSPAEPVMILTADHGSRLLPTERNYTERALINPNCADRETFARAEPPECFSILKAFKMPGSSSDWFWDGMLQVDDFRIVFNHCFGAGFPYASHPASTQTAKPVLPTGISAQNQPAR